MSTAEKSRSNLLAALAIQSVTGTEIAVEFKGADLLLQPRNLNLRFLQKVKRRL